MSREILSLCKDWKYSESFENKFINANYDDSNFKSVILPHANKEIPYNYFDEKMYQFVSCYRRNIKLSREYENKCIFLDFEGVMTYAEVYVNGELLGSHKGGYTPFSINLTGKIKFDEENSIVVKVDSTERADIPPFGFVIDYLTYGGIYREVSLRILDKIYINNVFAKPKDALLDKKKVSTTIFVNNTNGVSKNVTIIAALLKSGEIINQVETNVLLNGENEIELELNKLVNIELWDIDSPNLYDLRVSLTSDEVVVDTYLTRLGFRDAKVTENGFYLNGKKVKIRGLNRHQAFPYVGYAMPARVQKKDADILKYELHLNTVRTSHYPQSRHFLDRCDEIGLLVLEEIPGWQHIGNEEWKKVACQNVKEMIVRDWNHPSIFLWGVRINESKDDHEFYEETNRIAHELDNTRQTGGIRCYRGSELLEDVYTMNDFIHCGEEDVLQDQKTNTNLDHNVPYIVTEFNGHMYPTKRFDQEERVMEHSLRHLRVHNRAGIDEHISGAIGWCAFDYNTHFEFGAGDRICYHGISDMFRIPKFAANFYKSQADPKDEIVLEPTTIWSRGERCIGGVIPLVIYTNCEFLEIYISGKLLGKYIPDYENYKGVKYPPVVISEMPGEWGSTWYDAEFRGFINGGKVIVKNYCKDPIAYKLEATPDDTSLIGDGSDATRVVYKLEDQCGNIIPYINEFIKFKIYGAGEIIGPAETALIGGCIAVWVKAKDQTGEIKLSASCSRFAANDIVIKVDAEI